MNLYSRRLSACAVPHSFSDGAGDVRLYGDAAPLRDYVAPRQIHGTRTVRPRSLAGRPADGLWTSDREVLAVRSADCVPVLMAGAGRVAAIHAGWRGIAGGIVERFVTGQRRRGIAPAGWLVALGPAAGGCCYEVGSEVAALLGVPTATTHLKIDLRELLRQRLAALGIPRAAVEIVGGCTICGDAHWASYRRQGKSAGRNLACIANRRRGG